MEIFIENLQSKIPVDEQMEESLRQAVKLSLSHEAFTEPCEVSILLVDNDKIRQINQEQRSIDKPTDVLSFPMLEMEDGKLLSGAGDMDWDSNLLLLGDIVLSLETAQVQAEAYGHSLDREVAFLTTHGMFHLLGYDHQTAQEEKTMLEKQEAVLAQMGLSRNA